MMYYSLFIKKMIVRHETYWYYLFHLIRATYKWFKSNSKSFGETSCYVSLYILSTVLDAVWKMVLNLINIAFQGTGSELE